MHSQLKYHFTFLFQQVYSTSMAMLLTMVLSVYLFNVRATVQVGEYIFCVAVFVTFGDEISLAIYSC
jgi:hypothetical protein